MSVADRLKRRISARGRAGTVLLVCALLGGVLAATVGAGYVASRPLLDTAGAYVAKGAGIVYVNAMSHSVEAEALELAPGKHAIETVTLPDGQVFVVDHESKRARKVDESTMRPGPEISLDENGARIVAAPDGGYLVDGDRVSRLGPDGKRRTTARLPATFAGQAVPDTTEGVWVLSKDHVVTHVAGDEKRKQVSGELRTEHLTVADHRPVGLTSSGELMDLTAVPPRPITGARVPHGNVEVGSPKGPGRWVLVLDRADSDLVATDIRTGQVHRLHVRGGVKLGQPVQVGDFAYVPDYDEHELHVLNLATEQVLEDIPVPGKSPTFSLEVRASRVWANDQFDRRAVVVADGNRPSLVDKGDGPGLTDTEGHADEPTDEPAELAPADEPDTQAPPPGESADLATVPEIGTGTSIDSACTRLAAAGLVCAQVPIGDGGEPGTVPEDPTTPPAGTRVPRGSEVAVRHYGPTQVPSVVGLFVEDACADIENTGLACRTQALPDLAPDPSDLDRVTAQSPEVGGDIPPGGEVSLRYYDTVTVENFVGRNGEGACADIENRYHTVRCRTVYDETELQTNQPAGAVYAQEPDTTVQTGQEVVLHVATESSGVPNVVGLSEADACAALEAAGYGCNPVEDAPPTRQIVVASQDPPAGTKMDSGTVTTHLPPGGNSGFVSLALCRKDNGDYVFRMLIDCQGGFSRDKWPVGLVYPPGAPAHPQLVPLYEYYCTGRTDACRGFTQNRYYSRNPAGLDPNWQREPSFGYSVVNSCTLAADGTDGDPADGLKPIYQVLYLENGGSTYNYTIRNDPHDQHPTLGKAPDGSEFLGCVWES